LRRPQAEQLVASGVGLELQLLVNGEPLLETFLALVERGHDCLAVAERIAALAFDCLLRIAGNARSREFVRRGFDIVNGNPPGTDAALHSGPRSSRQPMRRRFARAGRAAPKSPPHFSS